MPEAKPTKAKAPRRKAKGDSAPPPQSQGPATASAAEAKADNGQAGVAAALGMLSEEQRAALEKMSINLARAAVAAQGVIAEAALRQADRPAALTADPFHVAPALSEVVGRIVGQPDRLMRAQASLYAK